MSEHDWAKICSEIAVGIYGTRIVSAWNGNGETWGTLPASELPDWPLCVFPLEECKLGERGHDPTTLHTYRYEAVPKYHLGEGREIYRPIYKKGWYVQARQYGDHFVAFLNTDPSYQWRRMRKDSIQAKAGTYWAAMTLAIHKALMQETP